MTQVLERQYETHLQTIARYGKITLGTIQSGSWLADPRHLLFSLARYKFAAKMLAGHDRVLEVGCSDGFFSWIVLQEVGNVHGIDIDPLFINEAAERTRNPNWKFTCAVHDMIKEPVSPIFDAAYCLDVLEHIPPEHEDAFLSNITKSLDDSGECVLGMPSLESQTYASVNSKLGHVNCKTGPQLKALMKNYFRHVFLFSMNDEVVHIGYSPMSHYVITVCAGVLR